MDKTQIWDAVLVRLSEKISRMEFGTWFQKVRILEVSGGAILIGCPTEMNKNWLETKYSGMIIANLKAVMPEIDKVYYQVDLSLADKTPSNPDVFKERQKPRKLPNKPEVKLEAGIESRVIHSRFTLQNFVVGPENQLAHAACKAIAEADIKGPRKYSPLYIYGGVGLGKTHLLQGTANEILRRNPNALVVYTTAERFTNEMVKAIKQKKTDELRRKYRRADVLLIDDVQFFAGKEQTQVEVFNTFNDLKDQNRQMIFSADRPPSSLSDVMDRLSSRFGWGLTVDVSMPEFETKCSIIQQKSQELGIILPQEVQEFIANNIKHTLRDLENVLNKIHMELEIAQISPTIESVGKTIRTIYPEDNLDTPYGRKVQMAKTTDDVISSIAEYFQVPPTDLLGTSRKQEIVFPRQLCWLLCKDVLKMSLESIGEAFGGKNHTTIMHGIRKIKTLSRKDSATARHIHALKHELGVK